MKSRTLKYAGTHQAVEQLNVDALPEIIDGLICRAKEGDVKAALLADDREAPHTDAAFELDDQVREEDNDMRGLFARIGARGELSTNGCRLRRSIRTIM